jgi:hypothetical protein
MISDSATADGHDPGERGLGEAEVLADRGQRHVDDRGVEHDHQRAEAEDDEGIQGVRPSMVTQFVLSIRLRV